MGNKFDQSVLLQLRRTYSKDEAVAELLNRLTKRDIELGQLKSEIAHLQEELDGKNEELSGLALYRKDIKLFKKNFREGIKSSLPEEVRNNYVTQIKALESKLRELKVENQRLLYTNSNLQLELNNK